MRWESFVCAYKRRSFASFIDTLPHRTPNKWNGRVPMCDRCVYWVGPMHWRKNKPKINNNVIDGKWDSNEYAKRTFAFHHLLPTNKTNRDEEIRKREREREHQQTHTGTEDDSANMIEIPIDYYLFSTVYIDEEMIRLDKMQIKQICAQAQHQRMHTTLSPIIAYKLTTQPWNMAIVLQFDLLLSNALRATSLFQLLRLYIRLVLLSRTLRDFDFQLNDSCVRERERKTKNTQKL